MVYIADIMVWPTVGVDSFVWLFVFIIMMLSVFAVMNYFFKKQRTKIDAHGILRASIIGRSFSKIESHYLGKFLDTLEDSEKERLVQDQDWKFVRRRLFDFLMEFDGIKPDVAVRIYDRLYRDASTNQEFHIDNLDAGEVCALITEAGEELTRVMKSTSENVLLSSPKTKLPTGKIEIPAKLYVFRIKEGGYYIPGLLVGNLNQAIIFQVTGRPESAGHAHLMLDQKFQIEISNWPQLKESGDLEKEIIDNIIKNQDLDIQEELFSLEAEIRKRFEVKPKRKDPQTHVTNKDTNKQDENLVSKNTKFFTIADKLSDRGLTFEISENIDSDFWKISELWEVEWHMATGRLIKTRGKIFPLPQVKRRYLLKFVDMDESDRLSLYEDIKSLGGKRESLN
ncbi:hypothetical protein [Leptospira sp. GIMC2001]|uniref:hypothetical protein n=1 Tax=Leptospira sp. GIMC2001 TaxID=1513297 RepID=UPI002349E16B|nr:hypothetical protein [Leptospira sp. GIMC2001]WCL48694.1 hypothetical protein O4O04_15490 [Leptospira sp. GIMC2001]